MHRVLKRIKTQAEMQDMTSEIARLLSNGDYAAARELAKQMMWACDLRAKLRDKLANETEANIPARGTLIVHS